MQLSKLRSYWSAYWSALSDLPSAATVPLSIAATSLMVTIGLVGLRQVGWLQPLELLAYDQMVRSRPDQPLDNRLLIVTITEKDIQTQKRFPLSDQTVANLLQTLQQAQPTAIGLNLLRDVPQEPGNAALKQQLRAANVFVITGLKDADDYGTPPPPGMPSEQVGFNDVLSDRDGVIRRALLFADAEYPYAFAVQLAFAYLQTQGITPQQGRNSDTLKLRHTEFAPLEAQAGGYHTIDAAGSQLLLNYRTRHAPARSLTLSQALAGKFDRAWVKGKIVLIGATARSAKDSFLTPFSPAEKQTPRMPGVEIHAQIVSQLLSATLDGQQLFWFWADWAEIGWIGAWAAVGGCVARLVQPLWVGVYEAIALGVLISSSYAIFLHQGWVPIAAPAIGSLLTAGIVVADRARQAQQQQQMMMKLLGQNTSPEIARALWKSRDRLLKSGKLPGQRLTATMLFTDIRNFSTVSEQMPPENLLEWLNEYLSAITAEVVANQGIINKFTGDGMLAVFGVPMNRTTPIEVSHDAQLAVICALAMGNKLAQLNQEWQQRGLPVVQMRVGIFTGAIVAGSLGGKDRLEYGVIGDSVNIAARLESYAKDQQTDLCRVLIAQETLVHLNDEFEVEPWGLLPLKGKQQKVDVYRVVGRKR